MKLLCCEIKSWVSITNTELYLPTIFISSGNSLRQMRACMVTQTGPLDQIQPPSIYPALLFFFNFLFFFWGTVIWAANAAWASFSFASNTDACLLLQYDVEKEKGGRKRLYWSFFLPLLMSFLHIWEATVWSLCLTVREAGERLPSTPAPHPSLLFFWIGS